MEIRALTALFCAALALAWGGAGVQYTTGRQAGATPDGLLATLLKIPVVTTLSEPNGPNGPTLPEIQQFAPGATYVPPKGEVNAWDGEDFVRTVKATGRKTLSMAGVWTSVCVMIAVAESYSKAQDVAKQPKK